MRIGPLLKWYGSKWSASRRGRYPQPIGDTVVEPYAGGAGYSLCFADRCVVLAESDGNLFALWHWLIHHATESAIREIPIGVPAGYDIRGLGLSDGQALLLKHWQRTNNVGDCWTTSPWGHLPGQWTANTRARVAEQSQAIKHWQIVKPGAVKWSLDGATYFIDPPYLYNYRYRSSSAFDFAALAQLVARIPATSLAICCEATDKKTGAVPEYLPFQRSHSQVTSRRKKTQSHHSDECIYVKEIAA